jgi:hypothetical protein
MGYVLKLKMGTLLYGVRGAGPYHVSFLNYSQEFDQVLSCSLVSIHFIVNGFSDTLWIIRDKLLRMPCKVIIIVSGYHHIAFVVAL